MAHSSCADVTQLRRYVVLSNKNEFIIQACDDIDAGYKSIDLMKLVGEELKDVTPIKDIEHG